MTPDDYRNQRGYWVVASIETYQSWPTENSIYIFRNRDILLSPSTHDMYAGVGLFQSTCSHSEFKTHQKFIMEFISSLVWHNDSPIWIKHWSGGSYYCPHGKPNNPAMDSTNTLIRHEVKNLPVRTLFETSDTIKRLALAFYREALSLEHYGYRFLSFYKIINLYVGSGGKQQREWINQNLNRLHEQKAQERYQKLMILHQDVGEYLYGSCRCAVAHAGQGSTIDPENPADLERLYHDMPLIQELARIVIEYGYGIKSSHTIWKEHLYELSGFKIILGQDIVDKIVNNENINLDNIPAFPKISICLTHNGRLSQNKCFDVFEGLIIEPTGVNNKRLSLRCIKDDIVKVNLTLDFANERLLFDPSSDFSWQDDGSAKAIEYAISYYDFLELLFLNAELEIWDHENKQLLSYRDPYIPMNIDFRKIFKSFNERKTSLKMELARRTS